MVLADGFYRLSSPLTLTPADSGTHGHEIIWTADNGTHPVVAGSTRISGWAKLSASSPIWVAQAPAGLAEQEHRVQVHLEHVTSRCPASPALAWGTWSISSKATFSPAIAQTKV